MAGDSEVAFKAAVHAFELGDCWDAFYKSGWKTYLDFAFATSDPKGADPALFDKEVLQVLRKALEAAVAAAVAEEGK